MKQKDSALLVIKRAAGVAPEVILRTKLHTREEACKKRIQTGFKNQGRDIIRSQKQGYQWHHKKDSCAPKTL